MRMKGLVFSDIRFQFKYGFYYLYFILTILYAAVLWILPAAWKEKTAALLIFTDPAAMGLFFMGAIILFEKSERVLDSIAISPVRTIEYVASKLISIAIISTLVGIVLALFSGSIENLLLFALGLFICSCLLSSIGLMIAANIKTLNQFMIATIPAELLITIPAIFYLFGYQKSWLLFHPGVAMMEICTNGNHSIFALLVLCAWTLLSVYFTLRVVKKMFLSLGGVKL